MAKKFDNPFIPKYIPNDLPQCEKDGLDTWYLQNKCNEEVCLSILRNVKRDSMYVKKKTIDEHFRNKKTGVGRGRFIKKVRDSVYAEAW